MDHDAVINLLKSCNTEEDWHNACQTVKKNHNGGYPPYWFQEVVLGGLATEVSARWGGDAELHVVKLERGE